MHEVHLRYEDLRPFSWTCTEGTLGRRVHEAWLEGQPCQGVHTHVALSAPDMQPRQNHHHSYLRFGISHALSSIYLDLKQVQACMAAGQQQPRQLHRCAHGVGCIYVSGKEQALQAQKDCLLIWVGSLICRQSWISATSLALSTKCS